MREPVACVMFVAVIVASALAAENVVYRIDTGESWVFQGTVYVGDELRAWPVLYTPGNQVPAVPEANTSTVDVGVFRMTRAQTIVAKPAAAAYATIPLAALSDVTILYSLYQNDYVFYGPPPREFVPHLLTGGCASVADNDMLVHFDTADGNKTAVKFDRFAKRHMVTGAAVCGVLTRPGLTLTVDCTNAVDGPETVLSASLLELGIHLRPNRACFYTPNHYEVDHTFTWVIIWIVVGLLATWIQLTIRLRADSNPNDILDSIAVTYSIMSYDIVLGAWNTNVFSAIQHSHTLYGFAVLRMVPRSVVDITVAIFSYGLCSVGSVLALLAITICSVLQTNRAYNSDYKVCTWGVPRIAIMPLYQRVGMVCLALAFAVGLVSSVWRFVLDDTGGMIVSLCSTTGTILHASTPEFASNWVAKRVDIFRRHDITLAIYSRWAVEFLLTTCLILNLPHDVSGHRSSPFRIIVSLGLSTAILGVAARDSATIYRMLRGYRMRHCIHPVSMFIIWFCALFGVGPFFSQTDALANKTTLSLYVAVSTCMCVFVPVFLITAASINKRDF